VPGSASEAAGALDAAYRGITDVVEPLDTAVFFVPTRCAGWAVCDLLAHIRTDAERALIAFATPVPGPADLNQVSYWSNWSAEFDPELAAAHAQHIRIAAAAYSRPDWRVAHWRDTAEAAVRAARAAPADGYVSTQDHVLSVPDFVLTLVVEATIHHLDLIVNLPAPSPTAGNLRLVRRTLTELATEIGGQPAESALARTGWDDATLALKATGRLVLTEPERADLGALAKHFPLFR
jgi:uncharacterized protein (TIGR03083 family)